MAVSDEISRIKGNIASAYTAASGKGATLPAVQNSANLAGCIDTITGGGGGEPVNKVKYGLTIDNVLGDVDENGRYRYTSGGAAEVFMPELKIAKNMGLLFVNRNITKASFPNLVEIEGASVNAYEGGMAGIFMEAAGIATASLTEIDYSSLETVGKYGLYQAFYYQRLVHVSFPKLKTVGNYGFSYAFHGGTKLETADFGALETIENYGFQYAFYACTNFASIDFSSLKTIGTTALTYAFYKSGLKSISFPSLTSVQSNSFASTASNGAFNSCTALTEIHFRADMQSKIEAMTQYANKWGATNASIIFDL